MASMSATTVRQKLRTLFATHGVPDTATGNPLGTSLVIPDVDKISFLKESSVPSGFPAVPDFSACPTFLTAGLGGVLPAEWEGAYPLIS